MMFCIVYLCVFLFVFTCVYFVRAVVGVCMCVVFIASFLRFFEYIIKVFHFNEMKHIY